ncbi:MAG TPA: polymer-forming cytoskeletal protein [Chitinivibrionales bacterium]|nr:polymer-forming cytoskeletal protein [Chitinivibrionales bacterium]
MAARENPTQGPDARQAPAEATNIGENISIEGTIRADEDIVIDGTLKGSIEVKSHRLTVGAKGRIEADVIAENVLVGGKMAGAIVARNQVHITANADFTGQVKARRIVIEDGAYIKASIELEKEEKAKPAGPTPAKPPEPGVPPHDLQAQKAKKPEVVQKQVIG